MSLRPQLLCEVRPWAQCKRHVYLQSTAGVTTGFTERLTLGMAADDDQPIERAIRLAGSPAALAKLLDVPPQNVTNWRKRGMPADKLIAAARELKVLVEDLTGVFPPGKRGVAGPLPSIDPERWARLPEGVRKEIDSFALWKAERAGGAPGEESKELFASHG